ncbi:MAG: hypothetical protein ACYCZD_08025 [Rhodanobacter sp.]
MSHKRPIDAVAAKSEDVVHGGLWSGTATARGYENYVQFNGNRRQHPAYSRLLIQRTDLPLIDVLALDRVQKKLTIPDEAAARLRKGGLIEGRKPNYFVSAMVAAATASKADYIRNRPLNDDYLAKLLTDCLEKFGQADRAEINQLLLDKLSDALTDRQKYNKVSNLLGKLRRRGTIENVGTDATPCWRLTKKN